jgi:hypothetical protein
MRSGTCCGRDASGGSCRVRSPRGRRSIAGISTGVSTGDRGYTGGYTGATPAPPPRAGRRGSRRTWCGTSRSRAPSALPEAAVARSWPPSICTCRASRRPVGHAAGCDSHRCLCPRRTKPMACARCAPAAGSSNGLSRGLARHAASRRTTSVSHRSAKSPSTPPCPVFCCGASRVAMPAEFSDSFNYPSLIVARYAPLLTVCGMHTSTRVLSPIHRDPFRRARCAWISWSQNATTAIARCLRLRLEHSARNSMIRWVTHLGSREPRPTR